MSRYNTIGTPSTYFGPNNTGGSAGSHELGLQQQALTRRFFADVLDVKPEALPTSFPDNLETVRAVQSALQHVTYHAEHTLFPYRTPGLEAYKIRVIAASRRASALEHVYVDGRSRSELRGVDGQPLSRTAQAQLVANGLLDLKALLLGGPTSGWMDGAPIDALRREFLPLLPEEQKQRVEQALETREKARDMGYSALDLPIGLLPLTTSTKATLRRFGAHTIGDLPDDMTSVRNLGGNSEINAVVEGISTPNLTQLSPEWLGEE